MTPAAVLVAVAVATGVAVETITGPRRLKSAANARHLAVYLLRRTSHLSYPEIGALLGGRDHSTIMHADRKIAGRRQDPEIARLLDACGEQLGVAPGAGLPGPEEMAVYYEAPPPEERPVPPPAAPVVDIATMRRRAFDAAYARSCLRGAA